MKATNHHARIQGTNVGLIAAKVRSWANASDCSWCQGGKLARLAREFADLAEIDVPLPEKEKQNFGLLLAIRPWVFSIVSALKRKR